MVKSGSTLRVARACHDNALHVILILFFRHQRNTIAPAFHYDYLKETIPLFIQKTEEVFNHFPEDQVFDAAKYMFHFSIDVLGICKILFRISCLIVLLLIGLAAFGIDFNTLAEGESNEYYTAYITLITYFKKSLYSFIPPAITELFPLPSG